jgi:hypothetical protein
MWLFSASCVLFNTSLVNSIRWSRLVDSDSKNSYYIYDILIEFECVALHVAKLQATLYFLI